MSVEEDLKTNIKNFQSSADQIFENEDYTSAFILYFKALAAIADYVIITKGKGLPKDHATRFRILETKFPDLYKVLDRFFLFYRQSYTATVRQKVCEEAKLYVKLLIEKYKIF